MCASEKETISMCERELSNIREALDLKRRMIEAEQKAKKDIEVALLKPFSFSTFLLSLAGFSYLPMKILSFFLCLFIWKRFADVLFPPFDF